MKNLLQQIENLPVEIQAGQRLMVGFDGIELDDDLRFLIQARHIGGIILFSRNVSSPAQLKRLCRSVQKCAEQAGIPPLFVAIDQEGGPVARLKPPFTQIPAASTLTDEEAVNRYARITATELGDIGINMNMAPVLDVAPPDVQSIMSERSYGSDPLVVSRFGSLVIEALQSGGIMAVAKHFPGIGRTVLDSHLDMPVLEAEVESLAALDLIPFQAAIDCHVAGVMLSHIFYSQIDPDWPASLSPRIAKELLRHGLGYEGLILTDDLDMGAIKKHYDIQTVIGQILRADIDVALICHKGPDIDAAYAEVLASLRDDPALKAAGFKSLKRILKLKAAYLAPDRSGTADW